MRKLWTALLFVFTIGHLPSTYRKLFRDLSNLFLTDAEPGEATVAGYPVRVVTNKRLLEIRIGTVPYQIDRDGLTCLGVSIRDRRFVQLRRVLNALLHNIPFRMSDTHVTYLQDPA